MKNANKSIKTTEGELLINFMYWYSEEAHPDDIDSIIRKYLRDREAVENENK